MLSNDILGAKLRNQLKGLALDSEQERQVVKELNYLSSLVIEFYLIKKAEKTCIQHQSLNGVIGTLADQKLGRI